MLSQRVALGIGDFQAFPVQDSRVLFVVYSGDTVHVGQRLIELVGELLTILFKTQVIACLE